MGEDEVISDSPVRNLESNSDLVLPFITVWHCAGLRVSKGSTQRHRERSRCLWSMWRAHVFKNFEGKASCGPAEDPAA